MSLARVGIIGDVHGEDLRLENALRFLEAQTEELFCTGDVVDGAGDVNRCCALLQEHNVVTVRGNHDRWLLEGSMRDLNEATPVEELTGESLAFLQSLAGTHALDTVAGRALLCHGVGENDMQRLTPDDYGYALEVKYELHDLIRAGEFRFMIGGHTHRPMVRTFDRLTVINAGTLYRYHQPAALLVDFASGSAHFYSFDGDKINPDCRELKLLAKSL
jgi:predicted phosphodiesterase